MNPQHQPASKSEKVFSVLIVMALACMALSFYLPSGGVFLVVPLAMLLLFAAGLIAFAGLTAAVSNKRPWYALLTAGLLLCIQGPLCSRASALWGDAVLGPVSEANLRGLLNAISQYVHQQNDYPTSFTELVNAGLISPKTCIAPRDPGPLFDYSDIPAITYSSYVYRPGKGEWREDPRIVLAYEYASWQPVELRFFPDYGQFVLFGDGRVELLEGQAFSAALRDDAIRRRELGWPTISVRPLGEAVRTATRPITAVGD